MTAMADLFLPLNPGILVILAGLITCGLPTAISRAAALAIPVIALGYLLGVDLGGHAGAEMFGLSLELFRVDALSRVFGIIFLIAALLGNLYAIGDDAGWVQRGAAQVYAGSAVAAVFAGDLITLFVFFELSAVASVFLIWARGTERSYRAGMRYLIVQIGAGVVLLSGVLVQIHATGSTAFGHLGVEAPGGWLILIALGIKCAFPLVSGWLSDAYPEATVSGTVILSAFTTKMAIYALARGYAGTELLIWLGAIMAIVPAIYALMENDLRRLLAYSLNSQLGFMTVGVGIGTELALNGTVSHAVASVLYKALLLMCTGAVLMRAGTAKASELGGLHRSMPMTAMFCLVGSATISAVPLLSGFVTKSMIVTASANEEYFVVWLVLLIGSIAAFLHSGIKVPYTAFYGRDSGKRPQEAPRSMLLAMGLTALGCVAIGVYPAVLYDLLPFPVDYHPYSAYHVVNQLQLLLFVILAVVGLAAFNLIPRDSLSVNLDVDWLYRKGLKKLALCIGRGIDAAYGFVTQSGVSFIRDAISDSARLFGTLSTVGHGPRLGSGVAMIIFLLLITLLVAYSA